MWPPQNTYTKTETNKSGGLSHWVQDKAIKRFQVRNMVDASSQRDLREASYLDENLRVQQKWRVKHDNWGPPQVIL